jgi:hypothetical protein
MENVEQNEYRADLLNWCNNIHQHWENMKPRFTKLFDLKSLDEWEKSCRNLKQKLETNVEVNLEDYHDATSLYEQWEILCTESNCIQEKVESEERNVESISLISDGEITEPRIVNDKLDELSKERIELIRMVLNLEIPIHEIRMSLINNN